jgi:hypothetical protein
LEGHRNKEKGTSLYNKLTNLTTRSAIGGISMANGVPSLTVSDLKAAAARLAPQYREPLVSALDNLPVASDRWNLAPFAWLTSVTFSDGQSHWTLTRDKNGLWQKHSRRGRQLVVPLDVDFQYRELVAELQKFRRLVKKEPKRRRRLSDDELEQRALNNLFKDTFLASGVGFETVEGERWVTWSWPGFGTGTAKHNHLEPLESFVAGRFRPSELAKRIVACINGCKVPTVDRALRQAHNP